MKLYKIIKSDLTCVLTETYLNRLSLVKNGWNFVATEVITSKDEWKYINYIFEKEILQQVPDNIESIVDNINESDCYVVEQIVYNNSTQSFVSKVIGKVFLNKTIHLCNDQLETILDLCNKPYTLKSLKINTVYNDLNVYISKDIVYIPMCDVDYVNDDIIIRKQYEVNEGYWIYNNNRKSKDEWRYDSRETILSEIKQNIKTK